MGFTDNGTVAAAPVEVSTAGITRERFAQLVLSALGVYDRSGMDPEDYQNVYDAYDALYQELKDDGLVTWVQSADELVPTRFYNSLVSIVAASDMLLGAYPQDVASTQRLVGKSVAAMNKIRRQLASAQPVEIVEAEYF